MSQSEGFETRCTDAPVCPHCGYEESDAWEIEFGESIEGEITFLCDDCGVEYHFERRALITYNTEKMKGKK